MTFLKRHRAKLIFTSILFLVYLGIKYPTLRDIFAGVFILGNFVAILAVLEVIDDPNSSFNDEHDSHGS